MRTYDSLINYTTITLRIREVEIEPELTVEPTMWEQIVKNFVKNIESIKEDCKDILIFIAGESPYLVIYGTVIAVIVILIIRSEKKAKQKRNAVVMPDTSTETVSGASQDTMSDTQK